MARTETAPDPVPESFGSLDEAAEFWDTHSFADVWDSSRQVEFEFLPETGQHVVAVQPDLMEKIRALSTAQGIGPQTLINVWLAEKVATASSIAK